MAFHPDTKILTRRGWKPIRDIRGHDRCLVRNFLGEAEFIQPLSLKKVHYEGELIRFGSTYWAASVTPDHIIPYDIGNERADQVTIDRHKRLFGKFRYIRDDKADDYIILHGDFERRVSISDEDWYTLVAYTVATGYISKDKNPRLKFMVDVEKSTPLVVILDKLGVSWHFALVNGSPVFTVNRDNNIARKLKVFLGARKRTEMYLPSKMVYGTSQALAKHFMGTFTTLVARPSKTRPKQLTFVSTNEKLLKSMQMLCLFMGYGMSMSKNRHFYTVHITRDKISTWSVRFIEKFDYSGDVYELDLFDGLVYVTERNLPVWLTPK